MPAERPSPSTKTSRVSPRAGRLLEHLGTILLAAGALITVIAISFFLPEPLRTYSPLLGVLLALYFLYRR